MRALVLVLVSAAVAAVAAAQIDRGAARASELRVGVVANTLEADPEARERQQRRIRTSGARWIREEFPWSMVEPRPGARRWARLDRLMRDATRSGLTVLPLLIGTPQWAGSDPLALPDDPRAFGRFAGAVAERYGVGGTFWDDHPRLDEALAPRWFEVWNEPYYETFSVGGVDPARYARMMTAAAAAGRAANPETRWLMAADLVYEGPAGDELSWLDAMYAAEPQLHRSFDAVAVHPYSFYGPSAAAADVPVEFRFDRIEAIRDRLAELGAGDVSMWITELGWSTCDLRPDCVSEKTQARHVREVFGLLRGQYESLVDALFVYRLEDIGADRTDREAFYGLLRRNGDPKPAWRAFVSVTR